MLTALPQTTPVQAIAYLNEQRAANGIPGNLTNDPAMSQGCEEYTNLYKPLSGQYPHEELRSQPGYTPAGNEAASHSDLGGGPGQWNQWINPWVDAPLHLSALFDPSATTAWYGETHGAWGIGQACMGAGGERPFTSPAFFSLPGENVTNVNPIESAAEQPFTPGQAVGIPQSTATGPTIILWREDTAATLQRVTLQVSGGLPVPTRIVTASTPAPPSPPGWPANASETVGGNYVIPVSPLKFASRYTLTAIWADSMGATYTQLVHFATASSARAIDEQLITDVHCSTCEHGLLKAEVAKGKVRVSVAPPAGQTLHLTMWRGQRYCVVRIRPCPPLDKQLLADVVVKRTLRLRGSTVVTSLPPKRGGNGFYVEIRLGQFTARGAQWPSGQTLAIQGSSG